MLVGADVPKSMWTLIRCARVTAKGYLCGLANASQIRKLIGQHSGFVSLYFRLISIKGDSKKTGAGMDSHYGGELREVKLSTIES